MDTKKFNSVFDIVIVAIVGLVTFLGYNKLVGKKARLVSSFNISKKEVRVGKFEYLESIAMFPYPQAKIGGKIYKVGNRIGTYEVRDIEKDRVVLMDQNMAYELKLGDDLDALK